MPHVVIRSGEKGDREAAICVWREANAARRGGRPVRPQQEANIHAHLHKPDAFLLVADAGGKVLGVALGMQGLLSDDGTGPPIPELCHISMVFVRPDGWGRGIGGRLVDATVHEARSRGYGRAQLWTQIDNTRAQRLYEGRGFRRTGREKHDEDLGEHILHYARRL